MRIPTNDQRNRNWHPYTFVFSYPRQTGTGLDRGLTVPADVAGTQNAGLCNAVSVQHGLTGSPHVLPDTGG